MAKAKETANGNVKLTLNEAEARMLRDIIACVGGNGPRWTIIEALNSVGYRYRDNSESKVDGCIMLNGSY